jgi:hypothetical protein
MAAIFRKNLDCASASAHSIPAPRVGIGNDREGVHAVTNNGLDFRDTHSWA